MSMTEFWLTFGAALGTLGVRIGIRNAFFLPRAAAA